MPQRRQPPRTAPAAPDVWNRTYSELLKRYPVELQRFGFQRAVDAEHLSPR